MRGQDQTGNADLGTQLIAKAVTLDKLTLGGRAEREDNRNSESKA